jgi:hypothetical protein
MGLNLDRGARESLPKQFVRLRDALGVSLVARCYFPSCCRFGSNQISSSRLDQPNWRASYTPESPGVLSVRPSRDSYLPAEICNPTDLPLM